MNVWDDLSEQHWRFFLFFFSFSWLDRQTGGTRNARDTRVEILERTWADRPITRSAANRFLHAVSRRRATCRSLFHDLETRSMIPLDPPFTSIFKFPLENGNQFSMIISRTVLRIDRLNRVSVKMAFNWEQWVAPRMLPRSSESRKKYPMRDFVHSSRILFDW